MPVFGVDDFDKSRKALETAGVEFDGDTIEVEGMVKVAAFFDPDRNGLMLCKDGRRPFTKRSEDQIGWTNL